MLIRKVIKLFERGNVCVCGLRGTGKDVLMSNVIRRRNIPYVSNVPYGGKHFPLEFEKIDCGQNTYGDFIAGNIHPYSYPYPKGTDVYVSDAGVYLPSQYCGELNKRYPYLATFQALSRHVGECNFHFNAQNLNRVYDKVREQSDIYISCQWVKFIGKIVIQKVIFYDKYDSAVNRVKPCRIRKPLLARGERLDRIQMYLDDFYNKHGKVRSAILIYIHKGQYDSHYFGTLMGGVHDES